MNTYGGEEVYSTSALDESDRFTLRPIYLLKNSRYPPIGYEAALFPGTVCAFLRREKF
jgi:hypothetical protein